MTNEKKFSDAGANAHLNERVDRAANAERYWREAYASGYGNQMESAAELGRCGVIAEIIARTRSEGAILDAGCGTGILPRLIDLNRFRYVGVDISERALELARAQSPGGAVFVAADLRSADLGQRFDMIVLNEIAYYLEPPELGHLISRHSAKGALLIYSIFAFDSAATIMRYLHGLGKNIRTVDVRNNEAKIVWHVGWFELC